MARQWWPLLIFILIRNNKEGQKLYIGLGLAALSTFLIIRSAIGYFRFTFNLTEDSLEVQRGVFSRQKLSIPFDRIQAVNFEQDLIHQFLNVVKVNIDTAGSGGAEVSFAALTRADAESIRDFILANRKEVVSDNPDEANEALDKVQDVTPWLKLSLDDLLKVGLGQNHLRTALIIVGFFFSMINRIEEAVGWEAEDVYYKIVGIESDSWWNLALVAVPFFLVISVLFSMVRTILRYFNLQVWRTGRGYRLTAGLLQRREQEVNLVKVQVAKGRRTWLERLLKQHTFALKQASSKAGGGGNFVVPGLSDETVTKLLKPVYGEALAEENDTFSVSTYYRWRLLLMRGVIPAALIAGGAAFSQNWQAMIVAGLWLGFSFWWSFRYTKSFEISLNKELLSIKRGVLTRRHELLANFKVQAVTMRQSPYQRRHTLATLTLHTAGGDLRLPFIALARAQQLRDYFLYTVETDERAWM